MEAISIILAPYKDFIGNVTGIVTTGQILSVVFILYDIYKKKTTKGTSFIPFLGGFILSVLSLQFGAILGDDAMIRINLLGFSLNVIFISFYYWYVPNNEKTRVWGQLGIAGAIATAGVAYAQYEDPAVVEFRFGLIITGFLFALVASPFMNLGNIIKNKSTEGLPFPLILSGTIVSFMWLLYGLCLNNATIVCQNIVMFSLSAVQLSLFVIYPSSGNSNQVKAKKSKKNK